MLLRTIFVNNDMNDSLGINGFNVIEPFCSLIMSNIVANTSANILGIPKSSIEKAKLLLALNKAIEVRSGPFVESTLYFVGLIIPKKSPLVENFFPSLSLKFF